MALWRCRRCGTRFAVGLPYCPQCTSTDHEEDGAMAKTTVHGGPSNAAGVGESPAPAPAATEPETEQTADGAPQPTAEAEAGTLVEEYAASTVEELREVLRLRKLPTSGTKAELVARLEADDDADDAAAAEAGE
jgi:hypothetical protein